MTVTLPGPLLFACVILGLPAAFILGEARHVMRARRRSRKRPVPGNATPPQVAAPRSQPRQTPAPGPCTWCGLWPAWDRLREQYVYQWEQCPAHQNKAVPR